MGSPVRGTVVLITVRVRDMSTAKGPTFDPDSATLIDPSGGVTLTVTDPVGTVVLNGVAMTKLATGVYSLRFQTNANAKLGDWVCQAQAVDSGQTHLGHLVKAFTLVDR